MCVCASVNVVSVCETVICIVHPDIVQLTLKIHVVP